MKKFLCLMVLVLLLIVSPTHYKRFSDAAVDGGESTQVTESAESAPTETEQPAIASTEETDKAIEVAVGYRNRKSRFEGFICVNGTANITAQPNEATIYFGIRTTDESQSQAAEKTAAAAAEICKAIEDAGINKNCLTTAYYGVHQNYEYNNGRTTENGYNCEHQFKLKICDIETVGSVVDMLTKAGATNVSSVQFSSSNKNELYSTVLIEAVNDAKLKAQAIADATQKTAKLVSISEENCYGISFARESFVKAAADLTVFLPDDINVSACVKCKFVLV